ncbi:MAG: ABC transporter ATP-binding protein [Acidobacteria bacterium]|nr:ABC transporter ATP-binding protein [Acidobacteriota bacterium]
MRPIIRVDNLSKQYRIGSGERYLTLRDAVSIGISSPLRRLGILPPGKSTPSGGKGRSLARYPQSSQPTMFWALKDVSFDIMPGEVVGIIGPNGAGKSTLLKILSRITEPTTGQVDLFGRVASLLEVGTGFHPELTGRENIYLNGAILGMKRDEVALKFDEIVDFAEVKTFVDTPVKHYSNGMYLRLAFAVAAHLEPEVLLVDEVLAVGDMSFQKKCLGKMGDVARSGRTVMLVSHNMAAIEQLCGRVLLISSGRLGDQGPADLVVRAYLQNALTSAEGGFDLTAHPARPRTLCPIIRRLTLYTQDGTPTNGYPPNEPIVIELELQPQSPIRDPRVAIAIEDHLSRRITTVASYFESSPLGDMTTPCRVRCTMPEPRLASGRYFVSVSISDTYAGMLDGIQNAVAFDITLRDHYRNGELYNPIFGPVLTSSTWERLH